MTTEAAAWFGGGGMSAAANTGTVGVVWLTRGIRRRRRVGDILRRRSLGVCGGGGSSGRCGLSVCSDFLVHCCRRIDRNGQCGIGMEREYYL